jgi:hypothetical protein
MAIMFRGTFDDSGDQDDPQHKCASFGGFIGPIDSWDRFEVEWKDVLDEFRVPYLHMKEFGRPGGGIYNELVTDKGRQADFFAALTKVIGNCDLHCFGSVVRTADLRRFNQENSLAIDAYCLALSSCIGNISLNFPGVLLDLRVDRATNKPYKKINLALEYIASHKAYPECFQNAEQFIDVSTFPKQMTFRNVQAIQAADFAAWEIRKNATMMDEFFTDINKEDQWKQRTEVTTHPCP